MENHLHLFQDPPSRFRGAPFWAWNCKLDKQRMLRQAAYFKEMGFGGFTIHSRTGLDTAYLGKEFLEIVGACAEEAKRRDMKVYLYDEDRWPSGSCGGNETKNPAYRSRKLVFSPTPPEECDSDECAFLACYRVRLSEGCLAEYRRIDRTEQGGDLWYAYRKIARGVLPGLRTGFRGPHPLHFHGRTPIQPEGSAGLRQRTEGGLRSVYGFL